MVRGAPGEEPVVVHGALQGNNTRRDVVVVDQHDVLLLVAWQREEGDEISSLRVMRRRRLFRGGHANQNAIFKATRFARTKISRASVLKQREALADFWSNAEAHACAQGPAQ